MITGKLLIVLGLILIQFNACNLFEKNANAMKTEDVQHRAEVYAPVGRYTCIDYIARPIGIEFEVLPNNEYKIKNKVGYIFYNKKLDSNNRRSVTWSGDLSKWDESFYVEQKGVKSFALLGKNDQRDRLIPSCMWVNPNQGKR